MSLKQTLAHAFFVRMVVGCAMLAVSTVWAQHEGDGYGLVDALNAGTSSAQDIWPFRFDSNNINSPGRSGGPTSHAIIRSAACWAPESVYQLESFAKTQTVTFVGLTPGAPYRTEIHNSENYFTAAGTRIFNVTLNGALVLTNYDIFASAGAAYTAVCNVRDTTADSNGKVTVQFITISDNSRYAGLAVFGKSAPAAFTNFTAVKYGISHDVSFSWGGSRDVHRYYLQASTTNGPWSTLQVLYPSATSVTASNAWNEMAMRFRVVASNGLGTTASSEMSFSGLSYGNEIAARGGVVTNDAATIVGITSSGDTGNITLSATPTNSVTALVQAVATPAVVDLGSGHLRADEVRIETGAESLTIGTTVGQGTLSSSVDGRTLTVNAKEAASPLIINAQVVQIGASPMAVMKSGAGTVRLDGGASYSGLTTLGQGVLAVAEKGSNIWSSVLSGAGTFAKTGAGRMTFNRQSPTFMGAVEVREGTVLTDSAYPFGSSTVVVYSAAALDLGSPTLADQGLNVGSNLIVVSGSGLNGRGAIINSSAKSQYNALANVVLAGNVVFGGEHANGRWDIRNTFTPCKFLMNGYNVEKVGSNMVCLTGVNLVEGGVVKIDVKEGTWSSETSTPYLGGASNLMTVYSGARFDQYLMSNPFTWKLLMKGGSIYNARNGSYRSHNNVAGPVELESGTVQFNADSESYFTGVIYGAGRLRKTGVGRIVLENATNAYAGGTQVDGGILQANLPGTLSSYNQPAAVTVNAGATLSLLYTPTNWSRESLDTLVANMVFSGDGALGFYVESAQTLSGLCVTGGVHKYGPATLSVSAPLIGSNGFLRVYDGAMNLASAGTSFFKNVGLYNNATVRIDAASSLLIPTSNSLIYVGLTELKTSRLVLQGNGFIGTTSAIPKSANSSEIRVGNALATRGILEVRDTAAITNKIRLGIDPGSQGAMYQYGGSVQNRGGAANDIRVGENGYGYFELAGGSYEFMGYSTVGCNNTAVGVMVQKGGYAYFSGTYDGRFGLSRGGTGVVYQAGGTFKHNSYLYIGENDNYQRGFSAYTIDGASAVTDLGGNNVRMTHRTNHVAHLNLNNGTLIGSGVTCRNGVTNSATAKAYVNFNGGTFRSSAAGELFAVGSYFSPDRVTIYPNGAVFDTSNYLVRISVPLQRPSGKGITSIAFAGTNFIGSPYVQILGGGGYNATAVANFDSASGFVNGVTITSPGCDFTATPTVQLVGGGFTNRNMVASSVVIGDIPATGGLTKKGSGTLTLCATNTYGGPTVLENGTLQIACDGAVPVGSTLTMRGGTLNAGSYAVNAGDLQLSSGFLVGTALACSNVTKTSAGALVVSSTIQASGKISIEEGAIIVQGGSPGLYKGILTNQFNLGDANPKTNVSLLLDMANTTVGWPTNSTAVYTGFVWNRASTNVTWTFVENFDDYAYLVIDGQTVLNDSGWNTPTKGTVTLAPGAHSFEARFGQGGGGAGPNVVSNVWESATMAFVCDYQGRDILNPAYFNVMVDPGDGSLFTTDILNPALGLFSATADLTVKNGASLLFRSPATQTVKSLAGTGLISNALVRVSETLAADAAEAAQGRFLTVVSGSLDLTEHPTLALTNVETLGTSGARYVLARAGSITGSFGAITGLPSARWVVSIRNNEVQLAYQNGTVLLFK